MVNFNLADLFNNDQVIHRTGGNGFDGTFYAVFDAQGKRLINCRTSLNVVAFSPESYLARVHFEKVLRTSPTISEKEIQHLLERYRHFKKTSSLIKGKDRSQ